jgi:hypothetical protein
MSGYVASMGEMINAYKIFSQKTERKRLFMPRRNWENNIKSDIKEERCEDAEWIRLSILVFWAVTTCALVSRYR